MKQEILSYDALFTQNKTLQAMVAALQEENDRLRRQLGIGTTPAAPEKERSFPAVTLHSTPQATIRPLPQTRRT